VIDDSIFLFSRHRSRDMVDWCADESTAPKTVKAGGDSLDLDALDGAMRELKQHLKVNAYYNDQPALREQAEIEAKVTAEMERTNEANLTEAEREERAAKQKAHREKTIAQRAEASLKESEAEKEARERAKKYRPGTMGIGIVPVDVGDTKDAYEYKLEFKDVTVLVPLPAGVSAKMLAVDIGVRTLCVGLKGKPPYLKGALGGRVLEDDTVWTIEEALGGHLRHIRIELTKADTRDEWPGALSLPEGWACAWSL
jgi:hypothetical protein